MTLCALGDLGVHHWELLQRSMNNGHERDRGFDCDVQFVPMTNDGGARLVGTMTHCMAGVAVDPKVIDHVPRQS